MLTRRKVNTLAANCGFFKCLCGSQTDSESHNSLSQVARMKAFEMKVHLLSNVGRSAFGLMMAV